MTITQPASYQHTFVTGITMTEAGGSAVSANGSITNTVGGTISFAHLGQLAVNFSPLLINNGSSMVVTTPTATSATACALTATGYFY